MKIVALFFWISLLILYSCESDRTYNLKIPDGTYFGTFQRKHAFGLGDGTATVSLIFSSNTWTGQSDKTNYPALCHGTYKIENNKIIFTNLCVFTADFDWSLILSGDYDFSLSSDSLIFFHNSIGPTTDAWIDQYLLSREK